MADFRRNRSAKSAFASLASRVGVTPESMRVACAMIFRAFLIGTILYLSLTDDRYINLQRNFTAYIVALVWCYYDGFFARYRWSAAGIEAIVLHIMAVQVGNLLAFVFGSPLRPSLGG
jgi:hypothetical protein